ncbi:unnamed protein product [Timema podura]|uniref:MD-2-related lipid-recognition domain-containing protein n=1 Tax=Timema podura TaxID=61482 RepID=A0ABN7NT02_TIMPD|nr:unnamed protein product [Timema podura]
MFQDIEVRRIPETGDFVFNGVINFTETVHSPWKMTVNMNKCLSNANMNTCTPFFSTEVKDVCSKLPQENQMWTKFIKDIKMKRNCPVGPEAYYITDMGSEPSDMKYFPLDNSFYTVTVTGFSKGKEIYCMYVTFQTKLA